ncbi:hypothetical protein NODU109028_19060 [Nocardioides dubius]|uniref:Sulfotransferase family protein n=1 Tax=Nocardioides dubius TaxID=317019 RepID=A0ABN1TS63_9ACTN
MAERLVLHIGAMKTGTTFLQSVFNTNAAPLAEAGVRFLGGRFGVQSLAVRDVLNLPKKPKANRKRWNALLAELDDPAVRTGVVSMEFLSFARARHLAAFFEPLADVEVEVVLTVRDMFRVIPAQWQTYVRNFGTDDWSRYQRRIVPSLLNRRGGQAAHTFHRAQDIETILERWRTVVPADRIHLVTVPGPEAPRDLLWRRFLEAANLPPIEVDLSQTKDNSSVGYASCDFLRRVNDDLSDVRPVSYRHHMRPLINQALAPLRASEGKPALDRRTARYAARRNAELRALLGDGPHRWVGDLVDLPDLASDAEVPRHSAAPDLDEVRRSAEAAWAFCTGGEPVPAGLALDDLVHATAHRMRQAYQWT